MLDVTGESDTTLSENMHPFASQKCRMLYNEVSALIEQGRIVIEDMWVDQDSLTGNLTILIHGIERPTALHKYLIEHEHIIIDWIVQRTDSGDRELMAVVR